MIRGGCRNVFAPRLLYAPRGRGHAPARSRRSSDKADAKTLEKAPLRTPIDLGANATRDIAAALNGVLADIFALYLKTKNFHWHMSGRHFRDRHLMLDEQTDQIFAVTDDLAERVRKVGGATCAPSAMSPSCSASPTTTRSA